MAYMCKICGTNEVNNPGDVCELCALGADPYAAGFGAAPVPQSTGSDSAQPASTGYAPKPGRSRKVLLGGGNAIANTDPYGNDMTVPQPDAPVQVYAPGQLPPQPAVIQTPQKVSVGKALRGQPITTGIIKNLVIEKQERSFISRWFTTLFTGTPYLMDDEITMFQIFPDYSGTSLNASGNACDQVVVYGKLNHGAVNENNEVEVYGRRDLRNNIVAKTIRNKASGTVCSPRRTISFLMAWILTLIAIPIVFFVLPVVIIGLILYLIVKIRNLFR